MSTPERCQSGMVIAQGRVGQTEFAHKRVSDVSGAEAQKCHEGAIELFVASGCPELTQLPTPGMRGLPAVSVRAAGAFQICVNIFSAAVPGGRRCRSSF